ncbi:LysR family transcriptional regulator [Brevibacillus choshinensis]|uniref:LysR family transcriptional regulator n=1 Tax=Brevibacillus choshinensis TaxID=54911 RepID=A0ABX7FRB7_BRECH|nr:LysR family transcriptional regulator [Brevibacillus choshinensis]QRG68651.1 LysR family transcriptional regulator [Brevibacillus choshinensis]
MNLEQLESIIEIAKTGSLTKASQNRHVTLSAISQSLSALEAELGITLFTRSRMGAVPTAEGLGIIQKAFEIQRKLQEIQEEAQGYTNTMTGELRLATIPGPMNLLVNAVARFKKDYPQVRPEIAEKGSQEILEDIRNDKIDIGLIIVYESLVKKNPGLIFEKLIEGKMVVGVSRNSPLALLKTVTPEVLRQQSFVLYNDEYVKWFVGDFAATYGPVDVLFTTNNTDAIRSAVREELAVTIGLDYSFIHEPNMLDKDIVTLEIDIPKQQPVYLGWVQPEERHFSRVSKGFTQRLKFDLRNNHEQLPK